MNITVENYFAKYSQFSDKINTDKLKKGHQFMKDSTEEGADFSPYHASEVIKKTTDEYLRLLNEHINQGTAKAISTHNAKPKATKTAAQGTKVKKAVVSAKEQRMSKAKATPKTKKIINENALLVEHIPSDIALVKKYIGLHNKRKSYEQVLAIWRAFEKAIVERKVTQDSVHQKTIAHLQYNLKKALEAAEATGALELSIAPKALEEYKAIAESVEKSPSVPLLLEFINISGKARQEERAAKLSKRMTKALDSGLLDKDRYKKQVKNALLDIEQYIEGENTHVLLHNFSLNGFADISVNGCDCNEGLSGYNKTQNAVILKLIQERVKNLTASELNRAFKDTVAPSICKLIARKLIQTGQLSLSLIRNPTAAPIALSGIPDNSPQSFDWSSEIMDMRVRQAAQKEIQSNQEMRGFSGLGNVNSSYSTNNDAKIISAQTLAHMTFQTIGLTGKYRSLIGDPAPAFSAMISGMPKSGKSTLAIDFAKELTALGKVLYCAYEEGHGGTLQDKIKRNNAAVPGLDFADKLPNDLRAYRFVFIDSVTDARMSEQDFNALIKTNKPTTSIIGVFHATKDGKFRGGQSFAHDVDVLMRVENGMVYAMGRYAPPSEMKMSF